MKRNKIKIKYLNQIHQDKNPTQKNINIFDKIERSIIHILISCGLILLLLTLGVVPTIILALLGIDSITLNETFKIIISFLNDSVLILLLVMIYRKTVKKDFKNFFQKNTLLKNIITSFQYWIIGLIIMVISNYIIGILMNGQLAANEESVRSLIDIYPMYMAFQLIIYAPLTEELIFRKSIRNITNNKYLYILISGLVFGGLHTISSISTLLDLIYLIPYCALGFIFAALYTKTDNIFSTITAHAFHNGLALIVYLMTVTL